MEINEEKHSDTAKETLRKLEEADYFDLVGRITKNKNINKENYCVVGSFVLEMHGIRKAGDIDLIVLNREKNTPYMIDDGIEVVGKDWGKALGIADRDLIENSKYHVIKNGLRVIKPEILFLKKQKIGREKDITDIKLIEINLMPRDDWGWELFKEVLVGVPAKENELMRLSGRVTKLLREIIKTPRKTHRLIAKKIYNKFSGRHASFSRGFDGLAKPTSDLQSQLFLKMKTSAILANQHINNKFSRYDILLRYVTIKEIIDGGDSLRSYYERMQRERSKAGTYHADTYNYLKELVVSIQSEGFNDRHPIILSEEGLLLDGAHRLALALYFEEETVSVVVRPIRKQVQFGRQWFVEHGFDEKILQLLDVTKDELFRERGVYFSLILWPPLAPFFDEITEKLSSRFVVKSKKILNLRNAFPEFVRDVYAVDDIASWYIELKIGLMKQFNPTVCMLMLEVPHPHYRGKTRRNALSYISRTGENLKKWLRESYKDRVTDYFYDITCHMGDNHEHNFQISRIVDRYLAEDKNFKK